MAEAKAKKETLDPLQEKYLELTDEINKYKPGDKEYRTLSDKIVRTMSAANRKGLVLQNKNRLK